jgi:hypothetical protein
LEKKIKGMQGFMAYKTMKQSETREAAASGQVKIKDGVLIPASSFHGVSANGKRWKAKIHYDSKGHYLGSFDTKQEAALAYDREARQCGEDKTLNYESIAAAEEAAEQAQAAAGADGADEDGTICLPGHIKESSYTGFTLYLYDERKKQPEKEIVRKSNDGRTRYHMVVKPSTNAAGGGASGAYHPKAFEGMWKEQYGEEHNHEPIYSGLDSASMAVNQMLQADAKHWSQYQMFGTTCFQFVCFNYRFLSTDGSTTPYPFLEKTLAEEGLDDPFKLSTFLGGKLDTQVMTGIQAKEKEILDLFKTPLSRSSSG